MKKIVSLLKAIMSQDMDLFRIKTKKGGKKIGSTIAIALLLMFSLASFPIMFMGQLPPNLRYITIIIFITGITVLTTIESIYKSSSILFDSKDSDLLFSLPINKKDILLVRIIKLLIFQLAYNTIFILPTFIIYALYENPTTSYYISMIIILLVLPIIPTIIGGIIGYLIKKASNRFKKKKIIETIFTTSLLLGVFYFSFEMENIVMKIGANAANIERIIETIYYPIKLYTNLIIKFNIKDLVLILLINIISLILFIYLASISYFKTSSKSNESLNINKTSKIKTKQTSQLKALIKKELKRFFSSTVYIVNAGFSVVLVLISTIILTINYKGLITTIANQYGITVNETSLIRDRKSVV